MWDRVKPLLVGLDPVRVENSCDLGTPDVNCTLGWIELKRVVEAPKRVDTFVRVPHFTPEQRAWLSRRSEFRGPCFMLLLVGNTWFLFEGRVAADHVGTSTMEELRLQSRRWWPRKPSAKDLRAALTC